MTDESTFTREYEVNDRQSATSERVSEQRLEGSQKGKKESESRHESGINVSMCVRCE